MNRALFSAAGLALCLTLLASCGLQTQETPAPASRPPAASLSEEPSETPSDDPAGIPSGEPSEVPSESDAPLPSQPEPAMILNRCDVMFTAPGSTFQLEPTFTGTDETPVVVWTSSDERVAAVDSHGRITSVAPGTATISGQTTTGLAASCMVRCRWEQPSSQPVEADLSAFAASLLERYDFGDLALAQDSRTDSLFPGLTALSARQRLVYLCQDGSNSAELVLLQLTSAGDAQAAQAILQARVDTMAGGGAWFPEASRLWAEHARVVSHGSYVLLVVHPQCDAVADEFLALF